jgi:hypothetical protein
MASRMLYQDEADEFFRTLREQRAQPLPGEHRLTEAEAEEQFWKPRREAAARERAEIEYHRTHTSDGRKVNNAD